MVATEWTSKEQKEWLTSHLPGYSKCSSKASYAKFWPPVYEQWEEKWPIRKELWPDLPQDEALNAVQLDIMGKAVKKRQKQLRMWVSWHSARSASHKGRATQSSVRATRILKDLLQPRGARALSEAEMYSRLYYKTSIRPSVEAAISECGSTTRGERLTIVRDMARQCWEREADATIIADVKARMKAKKKSKKSNEDSEDDDEALEDYNEEEELTTEDVLETQENLPAIFNTILMYLAQRTKFSFLVLMGGPDPSNNNTITVSSVDVGTTRLGHLAPQCLPDFKENFLGMYLRFLQGIQGNSPEPEGEDEDKSEGEDEGEVEAEEHEDRDEMDADPFADEPENELEENELEVSKGQSEGDVLDGEMDGKQNAQEQIPDIYSPNYAMHGSIQPKDRSTFQNINMHDPLNLAMHDGNSNFMDTTNFHSNLSLLFNNYGYWTPAPTGQYNTFENYQTSGQVPSYPQPYNYLPSQSSDPHPSDTLPPLPPVPLDNSPADPHL
ncbi:hypothetical protein DFH29DRAFT_1002772 [Suillus ampliporus]|nr:hypothetical protein DFH29DRAFT_1002772 [Suillus ampliporus]